MKQKGLVLVGLFFLGQGTLASRYSELTGRAEFYKNLGEALFDSSNSYHASAYLLGWTTRFSYMSSQEFQETMKLASCSPLNAGLQAQVGDVGLIYNSQRQILESTDLPAAFVWGEGQDQIFLKETIRSPIIESSLRRLSQNLGIDLRCLEAEHLRPAEISCHYFVKSYRCGFQLMASSNNKKLDDIEKLLSTYVLGIRIVEDADMLRVKRQLKNIKAKLDLKKDTWLISRIESALRQVEMIQNP